MDINSNLIISKVEVSDRGSNIEAVTEDLTILNPAYASAVRFGKGKRFFSKSVEQYLCFLKYSDGKYTLPRYYFGEPYKRLPRHIGRITSYKSFIALRDYQNTFVDDNEKILDSVTGLLLEAPCGHGKTVLGIWRSFQLGYQTIVVVPTYYLAKQWRSRIKETTTASVHIMTSKDTEVPVDSDFTIVVMDLFTARCLPEMLVKNVGHVIIDEAHRIGADVYMPILDEIPAVYRTALTATFRRADGMHKILQYHFGAHIKMPNRFPPADVYSIDTDVTIKGAYPKSKPFEKLVSYLTENEIDFEESKRTIIFDPKHLKTQLDSDKSLNKTNRVYLERALRKSKELQYTTIESYLCDNAKRRKKVLKIISNCLNDGRTILVLSKRKDIMYSLAKYFKDVRPVVITSETAERSEEEENYLQNECRLIFGINQLAKEGLDIDRLDTLLLLFPMVDTEQAIGRVIRLYKNKRRAIAFYLVDNCSVTFATFMKAKKFFGVNGNYCGNIRTKNITKIF